MYHLCNMVNYSKQHNPSIKHQLLSYNSNPIASICYVLQNKLLAICQINSCRTTGSRKRVARLIFKPDQHGLQRNLYVVPSRLEHFSCVPQQWPHVRKHLLLPNPNRNQWIETPKTRNSQLRIEVWLMLYPNHREAMNWIWRLTYISFPWRHERWSSPKKSCNDR
jgi:hypothetical protein